MNRNEFIKAYHDLIDTVKSASEKARREGLLAIERDLDPKKADDRDIFHYGMRFVLDGVVPEIINKILSNIIEQEKDEYSRRLKMIQKEAVLDIQQGINTKMLHCILNSYTDLTIADEEKNTGFVIVKG
jgi:flagellar motor component MotA